LIVFKEALRHTLLTIDKDAPLKRIVLYKHEKAFALVQTG